MARSNTRDTVGPEGEESAPSAIVPAGDGSPERALAEQLLARAREEGVDLVGPDLERSSRK